MNQDRKYFGMSAMQIGILAGLAGAACLLFGLTGWFVFRGRVNASPPPPVHTPVIQSTPTLLLSPTPVFTETPTSIPYDQLIPSGWVQYKTALVELWLPPGFKPGNPKSLSGSARLAVPEMVITEVASKSSLYQMFVVVSYKPFTADSLDAFLDIEVSKLPAEVSVTERRKVFVNSTESVRFTFETRSNNIDINDLAYVFLDGGTVWYVEYAAQINEFFERLPTFEQSIKTFRVVR